MLNNDLKNKFFGHDFFTTFNIDDAILHARLNMLSRESLINRMTQAVSYMKLALLYSENLEKEIDALKMQVADLNHKLHCCQNPTPEWTDMLNRLSEGLERLKHSKNNLQ